MIKFLPGICLYLFLPSAQYARAVTTYSFLIDQQLSEVVQSIDIPVGFPNINPIQTHQISGSFKLEVDTSNEIYSSPAARLSPLNIEVDPLTDPEFLFPSFFLRSFTQVDSDTSNFFGESNSCDEFNARRDRGGSCWSNPFIRRSVVSGMLDGTTLHLSGTNPNGEFTLPGHEFDVDQSYEYDIYATLTTSVPGDVDLDFDVDGNDFLLWQRAPRYSNLADWLTHSGTAAEASIGLESIPEPATIVLLIISFAALPHRR